MKLLAAAQVKKVFHKCIHNVHQSVCTDVCTSDLFRKKNKNKTLIRV